MFKDFIEKIAAQYSDRLPFVVYRKPNERKVQAIFQNDDTLHYLNDFSESGFVFSPFDTEKKTVLLPCDEQLQSEIESLNSYPDKNFELKYDDCQREFHIDLVRRGIERIRKGDFQKVVLSRRVDMASSKKPLDLFQNLLEKYGNAFCYLWYHPKLGTWLGATPEILLKGENRQITTMSLAGTQKYMGDENPSWGSKELEEQNLVTEYISNALKDTVVDLRVFKRETVRAGDLLHLRTKLVATYEPSQLGSIVKALHPTPAVCGMPMPSSKNFILKNENYDREFYTGYLGELNVKVKSTRSSQKKNHENLAYKTIKTRTVLFVNLRCMQLKDDKALIYVGGGITKDSEPKKEWEETLSKTNTMLKVIVAN